MMSVASFMVVLFVVISFAVEGPETIPSWSLKCFVILNKTLRTGTCSFSPI